MILIFLKNLQNQKNQLKKRKEALGLENVIILFYEKHKVFNAFESGIFQNKNKESDLEIFYVAQLRYLMVSSSKY